MATRVLVVDDELDTLNLMRMILQIDLHPQSGGTKPASPTTASAVSTDPE